MTTWALNVLRELVASPAPRAAWIAAGSDADERAFASATDPVLAKCHHYSPRLAQAADLVVYSYRDLRTAAVSAYRRFRAPGSHEQLDVWVRAEALWRERAHVVLRYEHITDRPLEGVAMLRAALQRNPRGISVTPLSDAEVLRRVDSSFERGGEARGESFDPDTLILPSHRTFQPEAEALPAAERAMFERVAADFDGWLRSHGYVDGDPRKALAGDGLVTPSGTKDGEALSDYVCALMREAASKESEIAGKSAALHDALGAAASAQAAMREKEAVIDELKRAVQHYRVTFKLTWWVVLPINYLVSWTWKLVRFLFGFLMPRLGVLHQHPPRPMVLPASYSQASSLDSHPRISIVTPSYQQAAYIERTIQSVLGQDYPALEYVVQDGGSQDGTREILQRYDERLASWESLRDSGQTEAINRGFARTSGEIMAWLNSDDVLLPGALHAVADFFNRHPDVDVVYGHRILIDEHDQQIGRWIMPEHNDAVLSWADFVPQETLFFRRSIWERSGGRVDETFRFAMDWDLLVRFRDAGAHFARLPRFIGGFRVHPQQKTSAVMSDVGFREMNRIRERLLGRVPTTLEVRKAVLPYLVRHVASDLRWSLRRQMGMAT